MYVPSNVHLVNLDVRTVHNYTIVSPISNGGLLG